MGWTLVSLVEFERDKYKLKSGYCPADTTNPFSRQELSSVLCGLNQQPNLFFYWRVACFPKSKRSGIFV